MRFVVFFKKYYELPLWVILACGICTACAGCDRRVSDDYWRRDPSDLSWGVFFSPILGIPEEKLTRWRVSESEMYGFNDFENRRYIDTTELSLLHSGKAIFFDCTKFHLDESLVAALRRSPSLIGLRIGPRDSGEALDWIGDLPSLMVLDIGRNDFSHSKLTWMSKLKYLVSLSISRCDLPKPSVDWFPVGPELVDLHASDVVFSENHIKFMPAFPKLRRLEVFDVDLSDDAFAEIPRIAKSLEFIWLIRSKGMTAAAIPTFGKLGQLRYAHLGSTSIEETEYQSRRSGGSIPALEEILPNCIFHYGT